MQFGRIPLTEITNVDLPPDNACTKPLNSMQNVPLKLYGGLSKWGDSTWVGPVYSPGIKKANLLKAYASVCNTIEINATYYRIFSAQVGAKWMAQVSDNTDFKFILKVPASLSAPASLNGNYVSILTDYLLFIDSLGKHYGGSFLNYTGKACPDVLLFFEKMLALWPLDSMLHIELRHPSWFDIQSTTLFNQLFKLLNSKGIGLVLTDTPGRRDVLHMALSCSHVIIRYVGYDFSAVDSKRLGQWKNILIEWNKMGLKNVFLLIHNQNPVKSLEMLRFFGL